MTNEDKKPSWYKRRDVLHVFGAIVIVLFLFSVFIMAINYSFPSFFTLVPQSAVGEAKAVDDDVEDAAITMTAAPPVEWPKGLMTANTLVVISEDLFSNWLPNDRIWPTVFLDNPQNFQLGELEMLRYTTRVMRDNLSRRTTDSIDSDCKQAFDFLSNDPLTWIVPSAESRYKKATEHLISYRNRLAAGGEGTLFFPQSDNLQTLLEQYVSLLGGVNTRLANAPSGQRYKISEEAMREAASGGEGHVLDTKVPWSKIDDNFYYAQGVAYVLRQMMVAIKYDFSEILENKKATAQVDSIIAVLNQAQFEPLTVLNGDIGSIMANHSMELHSLLENTRQKIRNLHDALGR